MKTQKASLAVPHLVNSSHLETAFWRVYSGLRMPARTLESCWRHGVGWELVLRIVKRMPNQARHRGPSSATHGLGHHGSGPRDL